MESSITLNPDEEITNKVQKTCLVGRILLDTPLHVNYVKLITSSSWQCEKNFLVSYIGPKNTFMFFFDSKQDFMKVLLDTPWFVNGGLLVLSPWAFAKTRHELHLSRSPFWVQVHGLPIEYFNVENGYEIARELGVPIRVDCDETVKWGKVMRVRVSVDVTKPLKTGFLLNRGDLPGVWVDFKYERLFLFCYSCGRIGHMFKSCVFAPSSAKFGPSLRASNALDCRHFGVDPRVYGFVRRGSSRGCNDLVVLPQSKSIVVNESAMEVGPVIQMEIGGDCYSGVTKSYLWTRFAINSIDSMVMVINSGIIFSRSSLSNSHDCRWRLLVVIAGYLIYLALKIRRVVRSSSFRKGYSVRIPLANQCMVAFVEILIFVVLFLIFVA